MASNTVLARLAVYISANAAELGKTLNQSSNQLKSFQNQIKGIGAAIGVSLGGAALFQGIRQVVGIMSDFEKTMSEVRAITGATGDQFQALEKDALRLGAATKFTASEVGALQLAYGRLGFTTSEILDATEATLALAAATGEDLAKSADVAGSTVRGFGLSAKETQRVVDVMAASFNRTALGLDNFTDSMKYVAPIAQAANVTVEETTALLGVLADAGIRGSSAGTALRKIFGDLSKDGRPVLERLDELGKKGITLADSFDEVGRTAQTALLVLTKNREKADELTKSFSDVSGEAERMARIMQDNLAGDVDKLTSAWEGLILSFSNSSILRSVTQDIAGLFNALAGTKDTEESLRLLVRAITEGSESAKEQFIEDLQEIRRESGKPFNIKLVQDLAEQYKLTDQQANELFSSILEVNKALSFEEKAIEQFQQFVDRNGYTDLSLAVDDYKQSLYELILAEQVQKAEREQLNATFNTDTYTELIKQNDAQIASYRRVISVLNEYSKDFKKVTDEVIETQTEQAKGLKYYQDVLKKLNDEFAATDERDKTRLRTLAAQIAGVKDLIAGLERLRGLGEIDVVIKVPDLKGLLDPISSVTKTEGGVTFDLDQALSDQMIERFEARIQKTIDTTKKGATAIKETFDGIDLSRTIEAALGGIGEAIGLAISGTQNLGKSLLGVFGSILGQFGKMLIATGVGLIAVKKAFQSLNGYVAIAAGVALVALGAAVSGSIRGLGGSFAGGGGSGATTGSPQAVRNEANIKIELGGEFIVAGRTMKVVLDNDNIRSQVTG